MDGYEAQRAANRGTDERGTQKGAIEILERDMTRGPSQMLEHDVWRAILRPGELREEGPQALGEGHERRELLVFLVGKGGQIDSVLYHPRLQVFADLERDLDANSFLSFRRDHLLSRD